VRFYTMAGGEVANSVCPRTTKDDDVLGLNPGVDKIP
jgi:hypothetical protein